MIERFARIREPNLSMQAVSYTRRVTQVWCVFFFRQWHYCARDRVMGVAGCLDPVQWNHCVCANGTLVHRRVYCSLVFQTAIEWLNFSTCWES